MISEAYADLGGGLGSIGRTAPRSHPGGAVKRSEHEHDFDTTSGWCECGRRDTGEIAPGAPAWHLPGRYAA